MAHSFRNLKHKANYVHRSFDFASLVYSMYVLLTYILVLVFDPLNECAR